jgi:ion channel-forming bestrophin family protein
MRLFYEKKKQKAFCGFLNYCADRPLPYRRFRWDDGLSKTSIGRSKTFICWHRCPPANIAALKPACLLTIRWEFFMIVRPKAGLRDVMLAVKGSTAPRIVIRCTLLTLLSCVAVYWARDLPDSLSSLGIAPFTLIGIGLSLFLGFRNSACFARWWEGRQQWGQLIIEMRSLMRETSTLRPEVRARMLRCLCGFAHALCARLRGADELAAAKPWLPEPETLRGAPNVADAVLRLVGEDCSLLAEQEIISQWRYMVLEGRLQSLTGVQAACERIKNTPLPFGYTLLIHRTIYLFCCLLPFGLAAELSWATPPLIAIVTYTFFGLDALGDELEDPFGREENDLPLDALVRVVEREILAALGASELPEPLVAVDYVLL